MSDRQVKVTLVIDDKGSVKVMRQAGEEGQRTEGKLKHLDKGVKELGKSFGGLKGMIGMGLGALGAGGLAFGIKDIASKTSELATETENFHSISGLGATSSLRYVAALKARGIGGEAAGKAFRFLAKNIQTAERQEHTFRVAQEKAAAKGKIATGLLGVQAEGFKRLGINLAHFNKLTEEQKLETITKKFEALHPGVEKTRLAVQLFGRGGTALLPVLEKNNLGLTHQMALVKKFFPEIKGGAHALDELREKQAESKMAWEGLEFTIGQKMIPAMTSVMGAMSEVAVEIEHGKGVWGGLERDIEGVASAGKDVVGFLVKMGKAFNIPVEAGGLGAALATFAGIHTVKHPIKTVGTLGKIVKTVTGGGAAEGAGAATAASRAERMANLVGKGLHYGGPAAIPLAGYAGLALLVQNAKMGLLGLASSAGSPGPGMKYSPKQLSELAQAKRASVRENEALAHESQPAFEARWRREERQQAGGQLHANGGGGFKLDLHLDTTKIAEALLHNPRARRLIGESTAIYAQGMTARK